MNRKGPIKTSVRIQKDVIQVYERIEVSDYVYHFLIESVINGILLLLLCKILVNLSIRYEILLRLFRTETERQRSKDVIRYTLILNKTLDQIISSSRW